MMMNAKAFLFDLNATIIVDMYYHAEAWFDILNNNLGTGLSWDEVKVQMYEKKMSCSSVYLATTILLKSVLKNYLLKKKGGINKVIFLNLC